MIEPIYKEIFNVGFEIEHLQSTLDKEVEEITIAKLATFSIPFSMSSDEQIVAELDMQKTILEAKLFGLQ